MAISPDCEIMSCAVSQSGDSFAAHQNVTNTRVFFLDNALFCLSHVVLVCGGWVVLYIVGLWLLLGCDNIHNLVRI